MKTEPIINLSGKPISKKDLRKDEVICAKCKGFGFLTKIKINGIYTHSNICNKCNGKGKLDWIKNIVGENNEFF